MAQARTVSSSAHDDAARYGCANVSKSVGPPRVTKLDGAP